MFHDYGDYYQDDDVIDDSDDTFDDDNTNGTARTYKKKKMTNHNSCVANIPMAYIINIFALRRAHIIFLAVQNSSIGDLVTNWLTNSLLLLPYKEQS